MKKIKIKKSVSGTLKKSVFVTCCILVLSTVIFLFVPIKNKAEEKPKTTVITVWHVDMFEGGEGSRKGVLSSIAKKYEKGKKSVYISVIEQSRDGMEQKLAAGICPDLISFSAGIDGVENYAQKIPVKDNFAGYSSDGFYAAAWVYGGYFLLTHGDDYEKLYLSDSGANAPYIAAYFGKIDVKNARSFSPEKAFSLFLSDKTSGLIGTQRDLCRIKKSGVGVKVKPVCGFTDLVQYISVTSKQNYEHSLDFLKFVIESDEDISRLKLMPASKNYKIKDDFVMENLSKIKADYGVWAFESREVIEKADEYAKCLSLGQVDEIKNLKNSLKSLKIN